MDKTIKTTGKNEALKYSKLFSNEYHTKRILESINFYEEIQKFYPCEIVCSISQYMHNDKHLYTFEHSEIFLKHDKIKIEICHYRKKYSIFGHFAQMYPEIKVTTTEPEPQKIGVLSTKKIETWIKYIENLNELYKQKSQDADNKIKTFKDKLSELPVNWDRNNKGGYIDKKGVRYTFNIGENGHIYQRLEITGSSNLETFLNLTN
jgi:hypothetical protein